VSADHPDRAHEDDAATRMLGMMRQYLWLVVLLLTWGAAAGAASAVLGGEHAHYEASALVIAKDVPSRGDARILAEQLPRLGEAVFTSGSVADRAVADGRLPFPPEQLIPEHAVLEPLEGTIVLRVKGIADEAGLAAVIANRVAAAFVTDLNRAGPGVGRFAIQDRARPPDEPVAGTSAAALVGVGIGGGFMLALALVALIMLIRRPVLSAADLENASAAPVLAALDLPVLGRPVGDPRQVVGLGALVRRLVGDEWRVCAFVSIPRADRHRSQLAALVSRTLAPSGTVALVAPSAEIAQRQLGDAPVDVVDTFESAEAAESAWVVMDGPSVDRVDIPQVLPSAAGLVLVVKSGTSRTAVEEAVAQLRDDELLGIVFVRPRLLGWWRGYFVLPVPADEARELTLGDSARPHRPLAPVREARQARRARQARQARRK
jgi:hypothetical protein